MFDAACFTLGYSPSIQFYDMGVEVGTTAHRLVQRFGSWKKTPFKDTFWTGDDRVQFTRRGDEIAMYEFDSVSEFKHNTKAWAANAIYFVLGRDACPSHHTYALLFILKKAGIEL